MSETKTIRVSHDMHRALRMYAAQNNMSMKQALETAIALLTEKQK